MKSAAAEAPEPRTMRRLRYEFLLECAEPVAHSEETIGNEAVLMRRKVRQPGGGFAKVPIVTADSMRHAMREAAAYALLDAAGMLRDPALSEGALRLLFAGGMVTGRGDGSIVKLDAYRTLCDLIPSMALFGGCTNNRIIPGRLIVEDAVLVCQETERFVPGWALATAAAHAGPVDTCRAHVENVQRVRMDPTSHPERRLLLSTDAHAEVNRRLAASEAAHVADDAVEREREKSSMLPRRFERLAQGSLFSWATEATTYSELDVDTFHVAATAFLANARVGGKRGTGHGKLRPIAGQGVPIARPAEALYPVDAFAIAPKVGELFRSHVAVRAERLRAFFAGCNA